MISNVTHQTKSENTTHVQDNSGFSASANFEKQKNRKAQICRYLQVLLLNAWQLQSNVTGTVCRLGLWGDRSVHYDIQPCQFALALIGTDWHDCWGTKAHRGKAGVDPSSYRYGNSNRWRWHFWLMSRHCWVTAVTLGLAAEKQWRHRQCRTGIGVTIGSLCIYERACVPEDVQIEIMWSIWVWNWHFTE